MGRGLVRWVSAALAVVAATGAALLPAATPAYAHAQLLSTTPANGARLVAAPTEVRLTFSEEVTLGPRAVRLLGADGRVLAEDGARLAPGRSQEVVQQLPAGLGSGTYTVAYRVASADSHPVHGAFVFVVGTGAAGALPSPGAQADGVNAVSLGYTALRWLGYAALALLAGGAVVLALCWPQGWRRPRARYLLTAGWGGSVVAAAAVLFFQGAYAAGGTLADTVDPALLAGTLRTDFGAFVLTRLGLLALGGALVLLAARSGRRPAAVAAALVLGVAAPATWIGTGHANADLTVATALASVGHLAAMTAWLGGLGFLVGCLTGRAETVPVAEFAGAIRRFSTLAAGCVVVLIASGVYRAWSGVGSLEKLTGSTYGVVLTFKVALVGVILWLGAMSRSVVRARYASTAPPLDERPVSSVRQRERSARRRLGWSMSAEVAVGLAVLALTSVLVATPPGARSGPPPANSVVELALADAGRVRVELAPPRTGPATLTVAVLDAKGNRWDVPEVDAALTLPDRALGPVPVPLARTGAGAFGSRELTLPMSGDWRLELKIRTSEIDQQTLRTTLPVG